MYITPDLNQGDTTERGKPMSSELLVKKAKDKNGEAFVQLMEMHLFQNNNIGLVTVVSGLIRP